MATIADVAKMANVSKATVSRVINNLPVSAQTHRKVTAAMKKLNYRPNAQARSLTLGRTNLVGVVGPFTGGMFYGEMLNGIISQISGTDNFVTVYNTENAAHEEEIIYRLQTEQRVDGLIIITPRIVNDNLLKKFNGLPIVVADGVMETAPSVVADSYGGAKLAVEHLINLGHCRIAMITGPKTSWESNERLRGYKDMLINEGIEYRDEYVYVASYDLETGRTAVQELLTVDPPPTAIFAANDLMAIGAMEFLREVKIRVPDDIAVVGFDNSILAPRVTPTLTSVFQPIHEIGRVAARRLLDAIAKTETYPTQTILRCELVVRESCGGKSRATGIVES
jgi:LacI family repressor for deo operon, udp, cdd, tsx, nupC, and nupG